MLLSKLLSFPLSLRKCQTCITASPMPSLQNTSYMSNHILVSTSWWTLLQYPQRTLGGRRPPQKNSGLTCKGTSAYFSCTSWAGQFSWTQQTPWNVLCTHCRVPNWSFRRNLEFYPLLCKIKVPSQMDFLKAQVPFPLAHSEELHTSPMQRNTQADFKETVDLSPFIISAL